MINGALDILQQPRIAERMEQIRKATDDASRTLLIKELFRQIQTASKSVVDKIGNGIDINNLDEVTTAIHNETKANTALLLAALKELKFSQEKQAKILADITKESQGRLDEEYMTFRIPKPSSREETKVVNLHEIQFPEDVRVNNLADLATYFEALSETLKTALKIDLPAPQVYVDAPVVNLPETQINIPESNFDPLIVAIRMGLQKIRTNNKSNPMFVRMDEFQKIIDKLEELRSGQMTALSGFPNQMYLRDINGGIINPFSDPGDTLKALANIAASTTDGSIVAAVTGKKIRVVSVACVTAATATNFTFNTKPAGAGSAITCLFANGANGGEILPYNPKGWFDTNTGEGLTATTGTGSTTGVLVSYNLV